MNESIIFPITELSTDLFESEKVFHAEYEWDGIHYIKEADIQNHYKRILVDAEGYVLKITKGEIIEKPFAILKSIFPPTLKVKFDIERTNQKLTREELRKTFLHRKEEIFHITHNKLMTVGEFEKRINKATTIKDLIEVATFEQDDLYD